MTGTPTPQSVLEVLNQERLLDLSRSFGIGLRSGRETKARMAAHLGTQLSGRLPTILLELGRDELRSVCRRHGIADDSRSRRDLQERLLEAAGIDPKRTIPPPPAHHHEGLPQAGQVVQARHR